MLSYMNIFEEYIIVIVSLPWCFLCGQRSEPPSGPCGPSATATPPLPPGDKSQFTYVLA